MKRIITILALFLCLGSTGCEDKENNDIYPDAKIIKELSLIYNGNIFKNREYILINSQQDLNNIFNKEKPSSLPNIDFNKHSLILGEYAHYQGISGLEHLFTKISGKKYEYIVTVWEAANLSPEAATFGIVINKIPSDSEIVFKINVKF